MANYIIEGTFVAVVDAASEDEAYSSFDPMDIDEYTIMNIEKEDDDE